MTWLTAIILGAVEGLTEFLPVSSTAHLLLASDLLDLTSTTFLKSFVIAIQLGAILAVVWLYRQKIFQTSLELHKKVLTAFVPTAIIGFLLYKLIKNFLLNNTNIALWALLLGGIFLIAFEYFYREQDSGETAPQNISYRQALLIGLAQALAVVPGVSRAAATILGGRALGLGRRAIVEFSFLLAIPTMLAATGYDLLQNFASFSITQIDWLLVGFASAFIFALISVKFLLKYIQQHNFTWFGIYRIVLALVFLFLF